MQSESIESSFLSIFMLITFFIFLLVSKYSYKIKNGILLDQDFLKPQAFHLSAISRSGGIAGIISLNILGCPEGIKNVQEAHSDVDIYIAQIDERLDENNYIRPGLGDAGDRAFNTNG